MSLSTDFGPSTVSPNIDEGLAKELEQFSKDSDRMDVVLEFLTYKKMDDLYRERQGFLKKVPNFWLTALNNHSEIVLELGNKEDQEALQYLEDIWISRHEDEPRVYTIEFTFSENPFFEEPVLKKVFQYVESEKSQQQTADKDGFKWAMLDFEWETNAKPLATSITWKDGQDLCSRYPRVGEDSLPDQLGSFFNWFAHPTDAFDIGVTIAEDLFDDAIDFYTGQVGNNGDDDNDDNKENQGEGAGEEATNPSEQGPVGEDYDQQE